MSLRGASPAEARRAAVLAQMLRFLAAGGAAALLNFASRFVFSTFLPFGLAVLAAFCVGLSTAFVLSRRYVFGPSAQGLKREMLWFFLVNMAALAQTWLVSVWLASVLTPRIGVTASEALAHFAGIMLPVVSSYFGHRYLTFRNTSHNRAGSAWRP